MRSQIEDPLFGSLVWDEAWQGTVEVPELGGAIRLWIQLDETENPDDPPTDEQRAAFSAFLSRTPQLRSEIEAALFDYYQQVRPIYSEAERPNFHQKMPDLKERNQIWRLLSHPQIEIYDQISAERTLQIGWNCTWDEEHGVAVTLQDERVVKVDIIGS